LEDVTANDNPVLTSSIDANWIESSVLNPLIPYLITKFRDFAINSESRTIKVYLS